MYLSLYCKGSKRVTQGFTERESETEQNCNIWPSSLCLSRSPGLLNRRPTLLGAAFSTASYHQLVWSTNSIGVPECPFGRVWLSLPHRVSNSSDLQLSYFLSSLSYIIVQSLTQSPTQSLEWHVWSSSSGNNCHAVQWLLSSGASVYECIMGFYLFSFRQPNPPTWFLSMTGHWNVSLPSGACLAGSKVKIQHCLHRLP